MAAPNDRPERQGIQSVEIGMRVLQAMAHGAGPMTLTEIAQRSGMEPSKVHRYLVSLCRSGLAAQTPSGRYDYGPAMRQLGAEALRRTNEVTLAADRMPGLRDRTGHSVNLSVWGDHGPMVVRWDYGAWPLPLTVRVGATLPLLSSSAGRVFLTVLPEAMTRHALDEALQQSPMSAAKLRAMQAEIRRTGVAVISDGVIPGLSSISAAVQTPGDALPIILSIVMPDKVMTTEEQERVTTELLTTTASISHELGLST